jgi:CheY-like chemotaxis protein
MDGYEATQAIRNPESDVKNRKVPSIAMTAYAMTSDRDLCLNAGMDDYISKPVDPQNLLETIERYLFSS